MGLQRDEKFDTFSYSDSLNLPVFNVTQMFGEYLYENSL